jgi:pimeloyl-ACP methyl ester carboxylesterase
MSADSGWVKRALQQYRVVLLDQRGTGRSTPVTHESLALLPNAQAQAEVLSFMRADNIVRDCETIRGVLLGKRKWSVLGQSFGGFCVMTYLSLAPHGLDKAMLTGGLPPVYAGSSADQVYIHTYGRMTVRNDRYIHTHIHTLHTCLGPMCTCCCRCVLCLHRIPSFTYE